MSAQTIFPTLRYSDAPAAIEWLGRAFGFERRLVIDNPDGTIAHAEVALGDGVVMLGSARRSVGEDDASVAPPPGTGSVYVAVDDADAHHGRARSAGAEIVLDLHDTDYGSREYTARDPEGNVWAFGTYRPGDE
ncbi:MAG: hypothetical protein QOJ21_3161 [Solirubrobacteraceae bacterium]|jgi:uncharacterized glyoxalase superfamily protein PhnB|nr:hypothetical protein [Solirubrobacteraceae bacterium]